MKPRIRLDLFGSGGWVCKLRGTRSALGETPLLAYRYWCFVNGLEGRK